MMNVFKTLLILLTTCSLMVIFSCEKEEVTIARDGDGVIISKPYIWQTSLSSHGELIDGILWNDISYNGNVLLGSQEGEKIKMSILSDQGKVLWAWDDFYPQDFDFDISNTFLVENILTFQCGNRFYRIDLSNGKTIHKDMKLHFASFMSGIGEKYFTSGNYYEYTEGKHIGNIYSGSVHSTKEKLVLTPEYSYEHTSGNGFTGVIGAVVPFIDKVSEDTLLIYDFSDMLPDYNANLFIGLYNLSKKSSILR